MAKTHIATLVFSSIGVDIGKYLFHLVGFDTRIISAIYVKPFLKGQKKDYNDAEAIAEATLHPNL